VGARARIEAATEKGRDWADRQDRRSFRGVAIDTWRCYRAVDGPLQSALLALYILIAVLPALLVFEEYLDDKPTALANDLVRHFNLRPATAQVVQSVLAQNKTHELGSAVLAIGGALIFGLGFGRVLQLVHVRAWKLDLRTRETDQIRFGLILAGVYGLILLLLLQLAAQSNVSPWVGIALIPVWAALLVGFFVWAPRTLTHDLIGRRELLPGAILTSIGLLVLLIVSRYLMELWVDLYARDYGGLGVFMALYFWIAIASAIIVVSASISPSLAERRRLRRADAETRPVPAARVPDP
jgi:membrane protein